MHIPAFPCNPPALRAAMVDMCSHTRNSEERLNRFRHNVTGQHIGYAHFVLCPLVESHSTRIA
ncbi:MAG: hypothetical protein OXC91_13040 [Rhodobacteraceae bacterium]|nr:hypothetical protein [Paracoccaceae bacterium]